MPISATQKSGRGLILFGNFVFLGFRSNSGMRAQSDGDLYLKGEEAFRYLTDYNYNFA